MTLKPFKDLNLRNVIASKLIQIKAEVDNYTNDEILANDLELLADNLYEEHYIPLVDIYEEDITRRDVKQTLVTRRLYQFDRDIYQRDSVEIDGFEFSFFYPYEGETDLFKCQASTVSCSLYPDIILRDGFIIFKYEKTISEMSEAKAKETLIKTVERDIESIKRGISFANADVAKFNKELRSTALAYLSDKKKKVESFFSVASMLEIPITKSTYSATHIPLKRNIVPISHVYDKQSSYCISDKDYIDILETIKHTGSTYERTPSSYKSMQEEDLRNALLAALNATYKGDATGETFRNKGKTDICIEKDNRAAFVAECKMWTGPKEVKSALEQLDGYLTWRDCKTALIYFVRRKNFFSILDSVKATLMELPFMKQVQEIDKNELKCCMVSESNPGQLIQVRVMLFNLYA